MIAAVAWVFPGQGSQSVGMGKRLAAVRAEARQVYQIADDTLGYSLSSLCWEGPEDELTATRNQQPALVATSIAMLKVMEADNLLPEPDYVAGHSLGEYSALVAAEALSLADALKLVRKRGQLMEEHGAGGMLAVIGLDPEAVAVVATETGTEIANLNSPGQIVLSGTNEALAVAEMAAKQRGARRVLRLPVNGAFHSSLMTPVAEELSRDIAQTTFKKARVPLVSNVDAEPIVHPDDLRHELVQQITSSVQWIRVVETMAELGVKQYWEIGPGTVLSGLITRIDKSAKPHQAEKALAAAATGIGE